MSVFAFHKYYITSLSFLQNFQLYLRLVTDCFTKVHVYVPTLLRQVVNHRQSQLRQMVLFFFCEKTGSLEASTLLQVRTLDPFLKKEISVPPIWGGFYPFFLNSKFTKWMHLFSSSFRLFKSFEGSWRAMAHFSRMHKRHFLALLVNFGARLFMLHFMVNSLPSSFNLCT